MTARSDIFRAGATPEFVELCATLYGDAIDPDEVWDTVAKAGPDQADLNASASRRNTFERGSNALGLTAGLMATGSALRDSRLADPKAGKTANRIHALATHKRVPHLPEKWGSGKVGAGLATAALGTQVLNTVGDVAIGSSYNNRAKGPKGRLARTGGQAGIKSARMPDLNEIAAGANAINTSIAGKLAATGRHRPPKVPRGAKAEVATAPVGTASGAHRPEASRTEKTTRATSAAVRHAVGSKQGRRAAGVGVGGTLVAQQALKTPSGSEVDYYKSDTTEIEWAGTFSKFEDDKQLAFGWASVSKVGGQPVIDKQGDYIDTDDLESAAYEYVLNSRVGGTNHARDANDRPVKVADIVESMVFTDDKVAKMGLPEDFHRGWWVGMKIHDQDEWESVKKGGRTGFSIHGRGVRRDQSVDELMGYHR